MHETCLIFNPTAGRPGLREFIETLRHRKPGLKIVPTTASGDGTYLADRLVHEGYRTFIAGGGDGTVNEIVNGLAAHLLTNKPPEIRLGVLPLGTQNVFAFELGIPRKLTDAWRVIEKGNTRAVDIGKVSYWNGAKRVTRFFAQLAGIGLDARAVHLVKLKRKKFLGPLEYVLAGLKAAAEPTPQLEIEAENIRVQGTIVLIGNGRYYGGPFKVFPGAANNDGKMNVCIFQGYGYLKLVQYFLAILSGRHTRLPDVKHFLTTRLTVTSRVPVLLEADGELLGETPAEFGLHNAALQVLVP